MTPHSWRNWKKRSNRSAKKSPEDGVREFRLFIAPGAFELRIIFADLRGCCYVRRATRPCGTPPRSRDESANRRAFSLRDAHAAADRLCPRHHRPMHPELSMAGAARQIGRAH